MIEERLADHFQAALANEPPLGFDPDDVVDRAARTHRRRTTVLAASAATATVALAAVTVLQVVRGDDGPVSGVAASPTTKPTVTKPTDPCPPTGTKTKPTEPTGTKPTEPKPTETKPTETKPTNTKPTDTKPTETKPSRPPCEKPKDTTVPFTGWEQVVEQFQTFVPTVLADRVPGVRFESVGVKPYSDRRCVAGGYQLNGDGYSAISVTVCHNQKTGVDLSTAADGDWGSPVSDTAGADGSHLRVYRLDDNLGAGGLAVMHHRSDGVVVQIDTGFKLVHGQNGPVLSQEQLTAIATDGRLTF